MDVAKQYAARNRQASEWFSHDGKKNGGNAVPAAHSLEVINESVPIPPLSSEIPAATVASPVHVTPKVIHEASPSVRSTKSNSVVSSPCAITEQPRTPPSTPVKAESVETPQSSGRRAPAVKPTCDSNQWYKFGQDSNGSASKMRQQTTGRKTRPVSQPVDWFSHDGTKNANAKVEAKMRVTDEEGASYCRRNKMGTSNTWFGHGGDGGAPSAVTARVTTQEGASNASRMRGESENWFNHSSNAGDKREPAHMSKGRVAARPQSSDMHNIFHHGN